MTQTPMTISVLPMCDQTMVIEFHSAVRPRGYGLAEVVLPREATERAHDEEAEADDRGEEDDARGRARAAAKSRRADPTVGREESIS